MDLVSVIVPIYNVEHYLRKCLDSIISQTHPYFEIILVDDGSSDSSSAICDEYAKRNNKIKVIHKKNGGLSDARNAGLEKAKGKYICFVDSDDWCEKDMLKIATEFIKKTNFDIVSFGSFYDYIEEERVFRTMIKVSKYEQKITSFENALPFLLNESLSVTSWGKLYKKEVFEHLRFDKGKLFEDTLIFPKLFENANGIFVIAKPLYHYSIRNNNSIFTSFKPQSMEIIDAYGSWKNYENDGNISKIIQMQNAWFLLIKAFAQYNKNRIFCEQIVRILRENRQYVKIASLYDRIFIFLIVRDFDYKKILFLRSKLRNFCRNSHKPSAKA